VQESTTPADKDRPLPFFVLVQVVLLAAGWGGNAPALRYSLDYMPLFGAAGVRFGIAIGVIWLFARMHRIPLAIPRQEWLPNLWMALLFGVQICFLNLGSAHTPAGRQALLINSYPLFVPVLAHLFLPGDRLTWRMAGGTLLAFSGLLLILGEGGLRGGGQLYGDAMVALSACLLAGKAVYTRVLVRTNHTYQVLFWQMVLAVPCFFTLSLATEKQRYIWTLPVVLSVAYQGVVVAGLCFIGWTALLERYSPSRLSVGFFLTPVFGALFSYLLLGETVTGGLVGGGFFILLGLLLVIRPAVPGRKSVSLDVKGG
jgi:drug/metabolite transporter (DMT)-like permease